MKTIGGFIDQVLSKTESQEIQDEIKDKVFELNKDFQLY